MSTRSKLFVMMVLEFFIWGAWFPLIFGYLPSLGFSASEQSWILNAFPIAAIVGMFFSNQFADRNFSGERFLAFSHLVGGLAILSLAFASMKDAEKEFGIVRMGGTIGWILAAWPFTFVFVDWAKVNSMNVHGIDW